MKPMLARTLGPKFDSFPAFVQPKFNGERALCDTSVFQSRGEKLWKPSFFPHIIEEIQSLGIKAIFDGELYVHGWSLGRIGSAVGVNNKEPNADTPHIEYHIFDIVDLHRPFSQRFFDIYTPLMQANLPHVKVAPTALVHNRDELELHFHQYVNRGYEGLMIRTDGPYEFGEHEGRNGPTSYRSKTLHKHKSWTDGEFMCVGVTEGEGKAAIGIGALICCTDKLLEQFNIGTGFDDSDRIALAVNPPIGKLIKVRYNSLTERGVPVPASYLGVCPE